MRGRQTISCASRPDRCVYPLHLFTQASAAFPQLEYRDAPVRGMSGRVTGDWALRCAEEGLLWPQLGVTEHTVEAVTPGSPVWLGAIDRVWNHAAGVVRVMIVVVGAVVVDIDMKSECGGYQEGFLSVPDHHQSNAAQRNKKQRSRASVFWRVCRCSSSCVPTLPSPKAAARDMYVLYLSRDVSNNAPSGTAPVSCTPQGDWRGRGGRNEEGKEKIAGLGVEQVEDVFLVAVVREQEE